LLERARDYTAENLNKSITDLRGSLNSTLNELSEKLLTEAEKFGEIQNALDVSKKNLELHYSIQVAAETLQGLVLENRNKKQELSEEVEQKRREWSREQEEYGYNTGRQRKRDDQNFEEEKIRKEKELAQRESQLKEKEDDYAILKSQVEKFPDRLEKESSRREAELLKKLEQRFQGELERERKEWESQKNIFKMKDENAQAHIKRLSIEIQTLRQETERANKKAQELAVKVIESQSQRKHNERDEQKSTDRRGE
jgi:hypothetical protein